MLASAAITGSIAVVGVPAYAQVQGSGVSNGGGAAASTGGNSSTGNGSTNVASVSGQATTPPAAEPSLLGGLLGLVGNVAGGNTANASTGTSAVSSGPAQASGNNSNTGVTQSSADTGHHGGGVGVVGTVLGSPILAPVSGQSAGVSNSGDAAASTGGNASTGNNSDNVASTEQTVNGGLIAIGLNVLGGNASNTSSGTSTINTGPASAAGNTSSTGVTQTQVDGGFGPGARFGIGGGAACNGFFGFGGQRVNVANSGTAEAATGNNTSVGNASTNVATNTMNVSGGLIGLGLNLLGGNATNASDGASAVTTGAASASGNTSSTAVDQQCVELQAAHVPVHIGPPTINPNVVKVAAPVPGQRQALARTGVDPFVLGLVAFALLFGGLLFMVWERVEAYPVGSKPAA